MTMQVVSAAEASACAHARAQLLPMQHSCSYDVCHIEGRALAQANLTLLKLAETGIEAVGAH